MTRIAKINENFSLSYNSREEQTGDTVTDIDVRFDNPKDDSIIIKNLNLWLQAIGRTDIVVSYKEHQLGITKNGQTF
jgi:hypothetical protein